MLQLYYSPTSPFVRKCLVAAHELGLRERLELLAAAPHPINRDAVLAAQNPLGKAPTLIGADGAVLYDSRVICEYLNAVGHGGLLPAAGAARWTALVEQALADGILDAAVLVRYETAVRPEPLRWAEWIGGQMEKVRGGLAELERRAAGLAGRIDVGTIAVGCALGYLDFRYASLGWRGQCPALAAWFDAFAARASMRSTAPPAP